MRALGRGSGVYVLTFECQYDERLAQVRGSSLKGTVAQIACKAYNCSVDPRQCRQNVNSDCRGSGVRLVPSCSRSRAGHDRQACRVCRCSLFSRTVGTAMGIMFSVDVVTWGMIVDTTYGQAVACSCSWRSPCRIGNFAPYRTYR